MSRKEAHRTECDLSGEVKNDMTEMTEEEVTEECYGLAGVWYRFTPPRPWLRHPPHDWVRTDATDASGAGDTLIVCQYCATAVWVKTTAEIEALPEQSDETWENRKHKCGDNHWVRKK